MESHFKTVDTNRVLQTKYGGRLFSVSLTTGWEDSAYELFLDSDGHSRVDRTRLHLAINTSEAETLGLAEDAMRLNYAETASLIQECRVHIAEGENEFGSLDVSETVERKMARIVLADMNPKHTFTLNKLKPNTVTNLLFLAIHHTPTEKSKAMQGQVKNIARQRVLV